MIARMTMAAALVFAVTALPAFAQGKKVNCAKLCETRCQSSSAKATCTDRCLPACEANHNKK